MEIKLNIQAHADRSNMIVSLANAGYKVWIEEQERRGFEAFRRYYVCFEYGVDQE